MRVASALLCALLAFAAGPQGKPWPRHTIDASSRGADGVKLADVNGEGRPDVVTAWEEGGAVRIYFNPSRVDARREWPRVTVGNVKSPEDAVFADLDGDLIQDVVSACEGTQRALFLHWAPADMDRYFTDSAWTTEAIAASQDRMMWMFAQPLDVDGKHGIDIVAAGKGPGAAIGWMESPAANPRGKAGEWKWHPLRSVGWVMSIYTADLDGDRDMDILFSDRRGDRTGVFWLENPGRAAAAKDAAWAEHAIGSTNREVMFVDFADYDGDGRRDVIAAVKPREIHIHRSASPDGRRWNTEVISFDAAVVGTAKAVRVADVNNDGQLDLVWTSEQAAGDLRGVVWMDMRTRTLHDVSGAPGTKYDLIEMMDLDADGDLDILTTEETEGLGVIWYENPQI